MCTVEIVWLLKGGYEKYIKAISTHLPIIFGQSLLLIGILTQSLISGSIVGVPIPDFPCHLSTDSLITHVWLNPACLGLFSR